MECNNPHVRAWIETQIENLKPDRVVWFDGSEDQYNSICDLLVEQGVFTRLNQDEYPNSFWSLSNPNDVARVEEKTFICAENESLSGPTNNWADPKEMYQRLNSLMQGCMQGRTMYVVPYLMGPDGSPYSKVGFELTDSPYVVANMKIMARTGVTALKNLPNDTEEFVRGVHSKGTLDPDSRYICHFPQDNTIISFNSDYGGNALQGKKCFALRIASVLAQKQNWLAEHMLILGITNPSGEKHYICAAFPSACGKTNLAMLIPPEGYQQAGWKIETIGDDIAWLNFGDDGRLYAINPENGFFGVAPGTSNKTNPNAIATLKQGNTIFTNTALDLQNMTPWWEGMDAEKPARATDWLGNDWTPDSSDKAAHPNSRFTTPAGQCPCMGQEWESPRGVPIDAIIFGGRQAKLVPLVSETLDWEHGTFVGLTLASEKTAAAAGNIGELRRDPMAMKPFIGYHVGDYIQHWLDVGSKGGEKLPKIFRVNWFRTDDNGKFLWPGFGENMRVLDWILKRVKGEVSARETAFGYLPNTQDLNCEGLDLETSVLESILEVKNSEWQDEVQSIEEYLTSLGSKLPKEMFEQLEALRERLGVSVKEVSNG